MDLNALWWCVLSLWGTNDHTVKCWKAKGLIDRVLNTTFELVSALGDLLAFHIWQGDCV